MDFRETIPYVSQLLLLLNLVWVFILYRDPLVDKEKAGIALFLSVLTFVLYQFGLVIPLINLLK